MEMLLTTVAFLLLTGFLIGRHLRATPATPVTKSTERPTPCVRCRALVPAGSATCPICGVPQQLFEIVAAPRAAEGEAATATLKANVRADMCVGCGTCVDACPEPGAIALQGKRAVVDPAVCAGHGECAKACPVGAITLSSGGAGNRVEVPQVDANFETNVRGLYIVGELGGRGLIKNAVNEGKVAIEHVGRVLPPGAPRTDGASDAYDVVIVGSGPAGLSAGLEAHRTGLRYLVLEQGTLSDTVRKYPRHKILFAEPLSIPLYGDLWIADASKETLLQVWETIIRETGVQVQTGQRVEEIVRDGSLYRVRTSAAEHRARRVVLAMGRRGTPRRLGVPGEDSSKVFYDIVEMEAFQGRRVLVVGGGDSAIESALGLANQAGTTVSLSYRGAEFSRLKDRNRDKIEAAIRDRKVTALLGSTVREIRDDVVVLDTGGSTSILPIDDVIVRIGGEAPTAFLQRLGVRIVAKEIPVAPARAS